MNKIIYLNSQNNFTLQHYSSHFYREPGNHCIEVVHLSLVTTRFFIYYYYPTHTYSCSVISRYSYEKQEIFLSLWRARTRTHAHTSSLAQNRTHCIRCGLTLLVCWPCPPVRTGSPSTGRHLVYPRAVDLLVFSHLMFQNCG